jgi:hypothetical protein
MTTSENSTLHREPILITELCDTDVTEITELPAEEAMRSPLIYALHIIG